MRFDQMLDRGADLALADPKGREEIFSIDFLYEPFPGDRKFPALMGLKKSQDGRFEIV